MKIENDTLILNNGRILKSIGVKNVRIKSEERQLEVYKDAISHENNLLDIHDYFAYDDKTNTLHELTVKNPLQDKEDEFISYITYKGK